MLVVRDVFPEFCEELVTLARRSSQPELADEIPELPVVDRCRCGQLDCAHFYTAQPPDGAYGPGHKNLQLSSESGLIVLDIVGGGIVAVEVLDRPDVRRQLHAALP